jgi:hypothetical protein
MRGPTPTDPVWYKFNEEFSLRRIRRSTRRIPSIWLAIEKVVEAHLSHVFFNFVETSGTLQTGNNIYLRGVVNVRQKDVTIKWVEDFSLQVTLTFQSDALSSNFLEMTHVNAFSAHNNDCCAATYIGSSKEPALAS